MNKDLRGFRQKKRLGQNFIEDSLINKKIIELAGQINDFNILEIGPGPGGLTKQIISANPKSLVAIEFDKDFKEYYKSEEKLSGVEFIFADAVKVCEKDIINRPAKIISNLPFNIASQLLFKWIENYYDYFDSIIIMVQKEFAKRMVACSGKSYGRLSVILQSYFDVSLELDVEAKHFSPAPKVDASVVKLLPKKDLIFNKDILFSLTRELFNYRRKLAAKSLDVFLKSINCKGISACDLFVEFDIQAKCRPEDINVEKYAAISKTIAGAIKYNNL